MTGSLAVVGALVAAGLVAGAEVAGALVAGALVAAGACVAVAFGEHAASTNVNRHKILRALWNIRSFFIISSEIILDLNGEYDLRSAV